jgi:glucose-6-phosphate-specific signal transduction histidine kinase
MWVGLYDINHWIMVSYLENSPNIAWLFLPAGVRLILIMVFEEKSLLGLFLGAMTTGWIFNDLNLSPWLINLISLIATLAPYLAYRIVKRYQFELSGDLGRLNLDTIASLALGVGLLSTLGHHLVFRLNEGIFGVQGLGSVMTFFAGDLIGTLVILVLVFAAFKLWHKHLRAV